MKLFQSLTRSVSALVFLTTALHAAQIVLNQNSIVNPGAELGTGSVTGNDIYALPGWTTTGNFTAVQYGAPAAPVISPGPAFGNNFFSGGPNNGTNMASQLLDASNIEGQIDAGNVAFVLSGWFGGYLYQNDNASLFATFFDATKTAISQSTIAGGFNSTARGNITQLLFDSTSGYIPIGTRSVLITLKMTREEGFYNDGYADNLSFVASLTGGSLTLNNNNNGLANAPEPATWVLCGLGLGAVAYLRRSRRG